MCLAIIDNMCLAIIVDKGNFLNFIARKHQFKTYSWTLNLHKEDPKVNFISTGSYNSDNATLNKASAAAHSDSILD